MRLLVTFLLSFWSGFMLGSILMSLFIFRRTHGNQG